MLGGAVLQALQLLSTFENNATDGSVLAMIIVSITICCALAICLYLGSESERAVFFIPYFVLQVNRRMFTYICDCFLYSEKFRLFD